MPSRQRSGSTSSVLRSPSATPPPSSSPPSSPSQQTSREFLWPVWREGRQASSQSSGKQRQAFAQSANAAHRSHNVHTSPHVRPPQIAVTSPGRKGRSRSHDMPVGQRTTVRSHSEVPGEGREALPSVSPLPHPIVQLLPQDVRRSRRSHQGERLVLPSARDVVLALPGGRTFSQAPTPRPLRPTVSSSSTNRRSRARSAASSSGSTTDNPSSPEASRDAYQPDDLMSDIIISVSQSVETPESCRAQEHAKKERQITRWVQEVIPAMLQPYLRLLRTSCSLRTVARDVSTACSCRGERGRTLRITCVYFDREYCIKVKQGLY